MKRFAVAQCHHQGCRGAGRRLTEDGSRVINNEPSVHARTRAKVQREIDALGYQPDPSARSLRSTRAYALGLVYDNPNAHYIINLQRGVLSVCRSSGFGLQIHPCDSSSPSWPKNCANWCGARDWPAWCWRRRCPSSRI
jgi:hypothetical protein